jgi:hypothetical protein
VPEAPRRTLLILVVASVALIGFCSGRVLSGPTEAHAAPAVVPVHAPASLPSTPLPSTLSLAALPSPSVSPQAAFPQAAVNVMVPASTKRVTSPGAVDLGLAGSAGYVPRTIPRAPHGPRPSRKSSIAASAASAAAAVAPVVPVSPVVVPTPSSDARVRELENVTRELASSL